MKPRPSQKISKNNSILPLVSIIFILAVIIGGLMFLPKTQGESEKPQTKVEFELPTNIQNKQQIKIPITIDTNEYEINTAEINMKFNPAELKIDEITKEGSAFTIWIDAHTNFDNQKGTASIAGGIPKEKLKGKIRVGTLIATPLKSGQTTIELTDKTVILESDGNGTYTPISLEPIVINVK